MLRQIGQIFVTEDSARPWHVQYNLGGDLLYLWSANGIAEMEELRDRLFIPTVATSEKAIYLWPETGQKDDESSLALSLPDGASISLRPEHRDHIYRFKSAGGEVALVVQKTNPPN